MGGSAKALSGRTFRLHCSPWEQELVEDLLRSEGFEFRSSPLHWRVRELHREPFALGSSLAAVFGLIYIQDKASLLPPLALDPQPGETVLDMCASPGSKTGLLAQLLGPSGLILANEPAPKRLQTLRRNMELLNLFQVCTASYSGQALPSPEKAFSRILLDAPCSGWGTVEKNPRIKRLWREEKTAPLISLQRQLLARASELVAPGGRIIYSTCTTNRKENEDQIAWARENTGLRCVRLFPLKGCHFQGTDESRAPGSLLVNGPASGGQSFFLACLAKPGSPGDLQDTPDNQSFPDAALPRGAPTEPLPDWSRFPPGKIRVHQGKVFFLPNKAAAQLGQGLAWQGLGLGKQAGGAFLPDPGLRLLLPPKTEGRGFEAEDTATLRRLLSGQSLQTQSRCKRIGLSWRGLPLGWLTVKGKRILWSGRSPG